MEALNAEGKKSVRIVVSRNFRNVSMVKRPPRPMHFNFPRKLIEELKYNGESHREYTRTKQNRGEKKKKDCFEVDLATSLTI